MKIKDGPEVWETNYKLAATEAQRLKRWGKEETISLADRWRMVRQIVEKMYLGEDEGQIRDLAAEAARLILSFPMTVQQIGVAVRAQIFLDRWLAEAKIDEKDQRRIQLQYPELLTIHAGDWRGVKHIFGRFSERQDAWEKALAGISSGDGSETVYRGEWLEQTDEKAELIRKYGLIPGGLEKYLKIENLAYRTIDFHWKVGGCLARRFEPEVGLAWLIRQAPVSPIGLLCSRYTSGEFRQSSPFDLGMGMTTPDYLKRRRGRFFGNCLFKIHLPVRELIKAPDEGLLEDGRMVLGFIPPEAITGHCFILEHDRGRSLLDKLSAV
ncbi:MAG: hypothetical protein JW991_04720 [Candidatus Pacebacteria bacterium]|nr:hypothetical protein [Candidatus Paceibacterota bacterium]